MRNASSSWLILWIEKMNTFDIVPQELTQTTSLPRLAHGGRQHFSTSIGVKADRHRGGDISTRSERHRLEKLFVITKFKMCELLSLNWSSQRCRKEKTNSNFKTIKTLLWIMNRNLILKKYILGCDRGLVGHRQKFRQRLLSNRIALLQPDLFAEADLQIRCSNRTIIGLQLNTMETKLKATNLLNRIQNFKFWKDFDRPW